MTCPAPFARRKIKRGGCGLSLIGGQEVEHGLEDGLGLLQRQEMPGFGNVDDLGTLTDSSAECVTVAGRRCCVIEPLDYEHWRSATSPPVCQRRLTARRDLSDVHLRPALDRLQDAGVGCGREPPGTECHALRSRPSCVTGIVKCGAERCWRADQAAGCQQYQTANKFWTVGSQTARDAVAEGMPEHMCRRAAERIDDASHVIGQIMKGDAFQWPGAASYASHVDRNDLKSGVCQSTGKGVEVPCAAARIGKQDRAHCPSRAECIPGSLRRP